MSLFDDVLSALKDNLLNVASEQAEEFADELMKDSMAFVKEAEQDLKEWTKQLANGKMTPAGFELAVRGKADVAKMEALKQAGLAAIRLDKLKKTLIDTVVNTATGVFLP